MLEHVLFFTGSGMVAFSYNFDRSALSEGQSTDGQLAGLVRALLEHAHLVSGGRRIHAVTYESSALALSGWPDASVWCCVKHGLLPGGSVPVSNTLTTRFGSILSSSLLDAFVEEYDVALREASAAGGHRISQYASFAFRIQDILREASRDALGSLVSACCARSGVILFADGTQEAVSACGKERGRSSGATDRRVHKRGASAGMRWQRSATSSHARLTSRLLAHSPRISRHGPGTGTYNNGTGVDAVAGGGSPLCMQSWSRSAHDRGQDREKVLGRLSSTPRALGQDREHTDLLFQPMPMPVIASIPAVMAAASAVLAVLGDVPKGVWKCEGKGRASLLLAAGDACITLNAVGQKRVPIGLSALCNRLFGPRSIVFAAGTPAAAASAPSSNNGDAAADIFYILKALCAAVGDASRSAGPSALSANWGSIGTMSSS